ncbi:prepilin peptidase [Kibdelosporangium lantanae]|uniref:Prepilin peptidase n=1 Tax=Kibdelosporangium lantanae TaxID=1497396 RepID=A0ABW3MBH0_9PSEU
MWTAIEYACIGTLSGPVLARWASAAVDEPNRGTRSWVTLFCATTAVVLFFVAARWLNSPALPAFGWFAMTGVVLCVIDLDHHRLPHAVVGTAFGGGLVLLGVVAAVVDQQAENFLRALVIAAAVFAVCLTTSLLAPGQLGFGDVTLFGTVSLFVGWVGWQAVYVELVVTVFLGGLAAVAMIAIGRTRFAFGPVILGGALVALLQP